MTKTEQLAKFVAQTKFEDLPENVVQTAKMTILDTLGCMLGTVVADPEKARVAFEIVKAFGEGDEACVVSTNLKAKAPIAAFANALLGHGIDFDDTHKEALTHTSAPVVPAALASAERAKKGGKDFILSFVLGFEVAVRVGMVVMPSHYKFWHSTATNCTFGAAAAAAKNYGLSEEQIINALGLCGTQVAGLLTYLEFGDHSKSINPGKTAFNGLFSALAAEIGATAPPTMLEHTRGYSYAYCFEEPKLDNLVRRLGTDWEVVLQNSLKPYPSLAASHSPMDCIIRMVKEHNIKPSDIKKVTNRTYNTVASHFSNYDPQTVMAARLSVPYCCAVTAATGAGGMEQFTEETIFDSTVREVLAKVEIIADPELNKLYPEKFPAVVTIDLNDGRSFTEKQYYPTGDPNNPIPPEGLKDKFRGLAKGAIDDDKIEKVIALMDRLEEVEDISDLVSLLTK